MIGRLRSLARGPVACICAAAWFCISNHCVLTEQLSAGRAAAETAHSHCGDHQAPADGEHKPALECCKTLAATAVGATKHQVGYKSGDFLPFRHFTARLCYRELTPPSVILKLTTGPPFSVSFAESVLQRSVLVHAPPSPLA